MPINPATYQLAARVNPTPTTIQTPSSGLFRGVGDFGTMLYNGQGQSFNLLDSLGGGVVNGNAGGQASAAIANLKSQYGIDYYALPTVNIGDYIGAQNNQLSNGTTYVNGQTRSPSGFSFTNVSDINSFLGTKTPATLSTQTINNTGPNAVAGPNTPLANTPTAPLPNNGGASHAAPVSPATSGTNAAATGAPAIDYRLHPGETPQAYQARIMAANPNIPNNPFIPASGPINSANVQPGTTTTGNGIAYDPSWASRGITQDVWNSLNANQQATIGVTLSAAQNIVSNTGSTVTLADALSAAATDPNLIAKYSDALNLDKLSFTQTLAQIQQATATTSQTQQMQFEADRKALAEQSAAAGQAYSGFRGLAEQNLATTESGIVTSSRSALQKQLNDATTAFEQKYGTSATNPATVSFLNPLSSATTNISGIDTTGNSAPENLSGALAGGITGTQPLQKASDINSLASSYVSLGNIPKVISP